MKLHEFRADERAAQEIYARECAASYKQHARFIRAEEAAWDDAWAAHLASFPVTAVANDRGLRAHLIAKGLLVPAGRILVEVAQDQNILDTKTIKFTAKVWL